MASAQAVERTRQGWLVGLGVFIQHTRLGLLILGVAQITTAVEISQAAQVMGDGHLLLLSLRISEDRMNRPLLIALLIIGLLGPARSEDSKGSFGFVAKVDAEGIFDPTLKTVQIQSVKKGLPADLAGIVAGDNIVEVDGIKVAGAKASVMAARMKKRPGESLVLRLLRTNGETYTATLSAVPQTP
ncbi:MAG: PDZ domain-containing protein [Betaproteobacteria bacterium]|nr:PDZ domain-containing protein [Betaproteobacteria bacterium]NCV57022.1 PDZ domain-containing protein [Betaproteobacteria bacterium]NCV60455.1 PDZ domain-containing protein [Betaproteobacteria bacterium]NCV69916.1 PDZ domain-containing protein [Betaproteobacteria bacterium]NCV89059.1 PDZ domain-containing protein [Betaproteobacteria bacterium]